MLPLSRFMTADAVLSDIRMFLEGADELILIVVNAGARAHPLGPAGKPNRLLKPVNSTRLRGTLRTSAYRHAYKSHVESACRRPPLLPHSHQEHRILDRRDPCAGAGNWREYGDFFGDRSRAAPSPAVPGVR